MKGQLNALLTIPLLLSLIMTIGSVSVDLQTLYADGDSGGGDRPGGGDSDSGSDDGNTSGSDDGGDGDSQFPFQPSTVTVTKNPKMKMTLNPEAIQTPPMVPNPI